MSHVEPCNVGFHFGTEAAARSRVDYLRSHSPNKSYRILKCQVEINAPYRVGDVFGHSYGGVFSALEDEAARQKADAIQEEIKDLIAEWLGSEDDPALTGGEWALAEYNARLNREVCRLFKTLGYDGLVYVNELEDGDSADLPKLMSENNVTDSSLYGIPHSNRNFKDKDSGEESVQLIVPSNHLLLCA